MTLTNKKLLKKLLSINSISTKEDLVQDIIIQQLEKLNFKYKIDDIGNILAVRGKAKKYPLLNAHMDIVDFSFSLLNYGYSSSDYYGSLKSDSSIITDIFKENGYPEIKADCTNCNGYDFCRTKYPNFIKDMDLYDYSLSCYEPNEEFSEFLIELGYEDYASEEYLEKKIIEAEDNFQQSCEIIEKKNILKLPPDVNDRVLGGDDKCGIFIALEVARLNPKMPMKILFTVQEEIGCVGIDHVAAHDYKFFNDISYSLTIDRKGGEDLLYKQLGTQSCSNEFALALAKHALNADINVHFNNGNVADVITIRDLVNNAVNISAGYYNAHCSTEYVDLNDVKKIIKWVDNIVNDAELLHYNNYIIKKAKHYI